jgi:hypothetical protein
MCAQQKGNSARDRFYRRVEETLATCPGCGGDGMVRDEYRIALGEDPFYSYVGCAICSALRDGMQIAQEMDD